MPHGVRPTEGRVREALFSIWQAELPGARVLDLFAGSGAFGLEALGRGAAATALVEGDPQVFRTLRANVAALGVGDVVHAYRLRLPAGLAVVAAREPAFDLAFADPPYGFADAPRLLGDLAPLLAEGGSVAFEHGARDEPPAAPGGWGLVETRCYGGSCLSFFAATTAGRGRSPAPPDRSADPPS